MRIAAFGDLHGDRYMEFLLPSLGELAKIDLMLLAGDLADKNDLDSFAKTIGVLRQSTSAPIVSVFGNEEYSQDHDEYRSRFPIEFLDDESITLDIDGLSLKIVGTQGSLDRPTWWQRTNLQDIWRVYKERVQRTSELLVKGREDILILLMHYSPTYLTMEGENENRFPEMGSKMFEGVIKQRKPDIVIHGHVHKGREGAEIFETQRSLEDFGEIQKKVPVINVTLPAIQRVTILELERDHDGVHITRI
ncbi:MAG TPA: metallophosphoesterase [Methanomassiliicoccales archaeon]|nr:metallophosphoesterase [Methanomassiliicoccales archaeon]